MNNTSSPMVSPDDPVLIKKAKALDPETITSESTQKTIKKMLQVALGEQGDRSKPILVGLAAPQIGISKRIIVVDVKANGKGLVGKLNLYINPEITEKSKEKEEWYEGCFSTDRVCGIVKRPKAITLKAYNEKGEKITEKHTGYIARIFQHEVDHLNGIEFVQHIKDDDKLHWVEDYEFPEYRNKQGWRTWKKKCSRKKWYKIKGIHS